MNLKVIHFFFLATVLSAGFALAQSTNQGIALPEFQKRAGKFNSVISLPQFETATNDVRAAVRQTIASGNAALDKIGALKPEKVTLDNTIRALDDVGYQISLTANRLSLIKETSTNAALRDTATD